MLSAGAALDPLSDSDEVGSSARISFSSESFLDESNFITICPDPRSDASDFEFLSGTPTGMITAEELMSEGKLLPSRQICHGGAKLDRVSLRVPENEASVGVEKKEEEGRMTWFVDEDPSPRPPKCTVLWKELLKLRRQHPSMLSPSASSSSSSSSRVPGGAAKIGGGEKEKGAVRNSSEKSSKRVKERSRSISIRIRPVLTVPTCTQAKSAAALPSLFSFRKGRLER